MSVANKDELIKGIHQHIPQNKISVEIKIDRTTLPKDGQYIDFFHQDKEEWFTGYFIEGEDLFWVNEKVWFSKWEIAKWKRA